MSSKKVVDATFIERLLRLISEQAKGKPSVFAKKAGIPHSTFFGYVNGRMPAPEHLVRIRDTFGVNINWLLTGAGEPYSPEEEGTAGEPISLYGTVEEQIDSGELLQARHGEEIDELGRLLDLARKVLSSGNRQAADALERNIRYFAHAIEVEGRLSSLEDKVGSLEGHLKRKGIMGGSQESEAI